MGIKFKGLDKLEARLSSLADPEAIRTVVKKNGSDLQKKAQRKAPYKTGNLRRSIQLQFSGDGMTATVEPTAHYAPYVEYGTRFMKAQPYLRPAYEEQKIQFLEDLKKL